MATTKVMRKLCAQIQSGASYESGAMISMPFTSESIMQNYDEIADESISGEGFMDIPQQGPRHTSGSVSLNIDPVSCIPLMEAAFGTNSSNVFTLGSNVKKMSMCCLNSANAVELANVYPKTFNINGTSAGLIKLETEVIAETAQVRDAVGNYPAAPTAFGTPFTFHEAGGTGYVRVGNQDDALSSSDDICIEEFSLEITTGFDEQYCNEGTDTLTPVFGMVPPTVSGSFRIARHDSDTFQDFEDAHTPLQMSIYVYKSATETMLIEIPNFVISCEITDDDIAKQNITMMIGRNGLGTSYSNSNMSLTSPVRITIVNS